MRYIICISVYKYINFLASVWYTCKKNSNIWICKSEITILSFLNDMQEFANPWYEKYLFLLIVYKCINFLENMLFFTCVAIWCKNQDPVQCTVLGWHGYKYLMSGYCIMCHLYHISCPIAKLSKKTKRLWQGRLSITYSSYDFLLKHG